MTQQSENIKGMRVKINAQADHIRKLEKIIADSRAAQKVAAAGLPEPVAVVDDSDEGMFIDFIYGEDGNPLRRGDHLVSLEAVEPLVAGLRHEVAELEADKRSYKIGLDELRTEVERLKAVVNQKRLEVSDEAAKAVREYRVNNTLRAQNAELAGLLRDAALELRNPLHCGWEDYLANRLDTALSAYEGREGE